MMCAKVVEAVPTTVNGRAVLAEIFKQAMMAATPADGEEATMALGVVGVVVGALVRIPARGDFVMEANGNMPIPLPPAKLMTAAV